MFFNTSNYKKVVVFVVIIFVLIGGLFDFRVTKVAHAENENQSSENVEAELGEKVNEILDETDTSELDDFLINDFDFEFFNALSFKDLALKVLKGNFFEEYDSLLSEIGNIFKESLKPLLSLFVSLLSLVILFELFSNLSAGKHDDLKKSIKIIFSLLTVLILIVMLKDISKIIAESIQRLFDISRILFPILLSMILLSGSAGSYSIYSTLSIFLLNTGSYIFVYLLLPLSISILLLSVFGSAFESSKFSRVIDIFKSVFKYSIIIFFAIFGLFSSVNMVTAGIKDGVSLKLTKFAIKNYVPILGGYISDGFNFVHSCSVLIKNAFGVCGIMLLFFTVLKPIIVYATYLLFFKVLSLMVLFVGNNEYSDMFNNVSKCMSNFITVLAGSFMVLFIYIYLLILSVSVVWWFINLLFHI